MTLPKSDVLQGTLDLMVLKTLESLGTMHGYGIAQRIQQISGQMLQLNQGTLYPALLRLEQKGWISAKWATTENNRRAKYYALTRAGHRQLAREAEGWLRVVELMGRFMERRERNETQKDAGGRRTRGASAAGGVRDRPRPAARCGSGGRAAFSRRDA